MNSKREKTLEEAKIERQLLGWLTLFPTVGYSNDASQLQRKYNEGYKFTKSQEKMKSLKYRNDFKIFSK